MKVAAMNIKTGAACYILAVRDLPTENGLIEQFAVAAPGRYADAGLPTAWVNADKLMILN